MKRVTKIFKAISSPTRTQILEILNSKGPQTYTQLMHKLKLNPNTDAGRFAYHLRTLLKSNLIEPDSKTKTYQITDFGVGILNMEEQLKKQMRTRKKIFVRTSRLTIEEFDKNRIVQSLRREARIPVELAQKIASETEKRLRQFKTKYLTAPLIREVVNSILIEKGQEEYRHNLTRLGLPVHDVTQLILSTSSRNGDVGKIPIEAGKTVIEEYTLLNIFPRDIADAHLSGSLHINNLSYWILKPKDIMHDLRYFLSRGLDMTGITGLAPSPPKSFESSLLLTASIIRNFSAEVVGEQTLSYFNVFLAPFVEGLPTEEVRKHIKLFLHNIAQSSTSMGPVQLSLGLEPDIPKFLAEKEAVAPHGKASSKYADYADESRKIVTALLSLMLEEGRDAPIFNMKPLINIRRGTVGDSEEILYLAHKLAAERGLPFFANLSTKPQVQASYNTNGVRFAADWRGDWELDTLQTGSLEEVTLNLPRIVYQAEGRYDNFIKILYEQLEMANRALEIKFKAIEKLLAEGLYPFLTQKMGKDNYFRLENTIRLLGFVGLHEAAESLNGENTCENTLNFAKEISEHLQIFKKKHVRKMEARVHPSIKSSKSVSERFARFDVEEYGRAKVNFQGDKEKPFYTYLTVLPLNANIPWEKRLKIEGETHQLFAGGHLALLQLADTELSPETLLKTTKRILKSSKVGLYVYSRNLRYCSSCNYVSFGIQPKCPHCGSLDGTRNYARVSSGYQDISPLTSSQRESLRKRAPYMFISE